MENYFPGTVKRGTYLEQKDFWSYKNSFSTSQKQGGSRMDIGTHPKTWHSEVMVTGKASSELV